MGPSFFAYPRRISCSGSKGDARSFGKRVLPCSGLLEDRQDSSQHAEGVQVQRAVRDIVVLQVQPLVVLDVRAPVAGPPAREAGLHLVVQRPAAVLLQLSRDEGARADDGHVAGHGVEELGQLVERRLAQDAAHGGDAALYCVRCLRENYLDCTDWVSSNISLCAILIWLEGGLLCIRQI